MSDPRFVILHHETPLESPRPLHWDLMLQHDSVLCTWALSEEPAAGKSIGAEMLSPHRMAYLEFEGELTENRGTVSRWDSGTFAIEHWDDEHVVVNLRGCSLRQCRLVLKQQEHSTQGWIAEFSEDTV